jgi:hypothetical protein
MTFFVACLDTRNGQLIYANAGHQFPYLYRTMLGSLEMLEVGGLPLGKSDHAEFLEASTELDLGDRLFLYTDGLLEEPNKDDEPFGYDRLESLLSANGANPFEALRDILLENLSSHAGTPFFEDDVTFFPVEYVERPMRIDENLPGETSDVNEQGLVRLLDSRYRAKDEPISPYVSRQTLVFLAETDFSDLLPRFSQDGIRRVLPRQQVFIQKLGWDSLLNQHQLQPMVDLARFAVGAGTEWRDYHLTHSEDKAFVIDECSAFLEEIGVKPEHLEPAVLAVDELLDNGLYAAPRDGRGNPLYSKGERRSLNDGEALSLHLAVKDQLLGLCVVDNWGTLTPAIFLERLARHAEGNGLVSGLGGAGFYLLWRLASYLQLRVIPYKTTQVTALFDRTQGVNADLDKGFQFLFHTEVHETSCHVSSNSAYTTGSLG